MVSLKPGIYHPTRAPHNGFRPQCSASSGACGESVFFESRQVRHRFDGCNDSWSTWAFDRSESVRAVSRSGSTGIRSRVSRRWSPRSVRMSHTSWIRSCSTCDQEASWPWVSSNSISKTRSIAHIAPASKISLMAGYRIGSRRRDEHKHEANRAPSLSLGLASAWRGLPP